MGKGIRCKISFYTSCMNLNLTYCKKSIKIINGSILKIPYFPRVNLTLYVTYEGPA
jgi:hypothetical protein